MECWWRIVGHLIRDLENWLKDFIAETRVCQRMKYFSQYQLVRNSAIFLTS